MKGINAIIVIAVLLIAGTGLGFYLWKRSIPEFSYDVVRIPMNELQDEERFEVVEKVQGRPALSFSQHLETYSGAEDLLKIEMDMEGNVITITETYASKEAEEQVCPYQVNGRIEPLKAGTYTIKVFFVDHYLDKTELLYELTVNFTVITD